MATSITEEKKVKLFDGTEISIRPLKISLLKDFMKKFEQIQKVADDNEKSMNVLMECVQIAMRQYKPDAADDLKALEELVDLPTVYAIVEAASGIDLSGTNIVSSMN